MVISLCSIQVKKGRCQEDGVADISKKSSSCLSYHTKINHVNHFSFSSRNMQKNDRNSSSCHIILLYIFINLCVNFA